MPVATHRIRTIADKRRWGLNDAQVMVRAWRESGLSGLDFCDRFRVRQSRLEKWATRVGDQPRGVAVGNLALYPARVIDSPGQGKAGNSYQTGIELLLPSGVVVRLGENFEAQALSKALQVLRC
jgi:hypothetical protein